MRRRGFLAIFFFLSLSNPVLDAQNLPGYQWSSYGAFSFGGYDVRFMKAPNQYVAYYIPVPRNGPPSSIPGPVARAFSPDLKTWTVDTGNICATSGDLCTIGGGSVPLPSGAINLPDGTLRVFFAHVGTNLVSATSPDGIVWTQDPGVRLTVDPTSIWERNTPNGGFVFAIVSFVSLPDGSLRMYYTGGIDPGSPGTPSYYSGNPFVSGVILSARSTDNGLTWTRDPGVRINQLVQGPINSSNQFQGNYVTAVKVQENGQTVYRVYTASLDWGTVSYVSSDSLNFVLEGEPPVSGGDPQALVLPDGRIWLENDGSFSPNAIVYGPQSLRFSDIQSISTGPFEGSPTFVSGSMFVTGSSGSPVTFEVVNTRPTCNGPCNSHPEYYSFSPPGGNASLGTLVTFTGPTMNILPGQPVPPDLYKDGDVYIQATAGNVNAVAAIHCMSHILNGNNSNFCDSPMPALPLNQLNFNFLPGAAAASQTSKILALGGVGYPFTVSSSVPWATVSPAAGTAPQPLNVTVNPAGLAPGTYSGTITVSAESVNEIVNVNVVVAGPPVITSVQDSAAFSSTITPGGFATIFGSGFAASPLSWSPTNTLPTSLGGVQVQIDGKNAYVSYAAFGQLNVLVPPDTNSGTIPVTVTTASGAATTSVTLAPAKPGWFTYPVGGATWIAAQIAGTTTLVAPAGIFGAGGASRPATAGDFITLYANGLGATNPAAPSGVVFNGAYPLANLPQVGVTIGGKSAPVQFAGLVGAGLYQVNVQVPSGLGQGDQPVVLTVNGQTTQPATLNFQ